MIRLGRHFPKGGSATDSTTRFGPDGPRLRHRFGCPAALENSGGERIVCISPLLGYRQSYRRGRVRAADNHTRSSFGWYRWGVLSGGRLRHTFLNNLPSCFNRVGRQIGTTIPFNEVPAVENLDEFARVTKAFECLISQIGTHIKDAHATVVRNDGQRPTRLWTKFLILIDRAP